MAICDQNKPNLQPSPTQCHESLPCRDATNLQVPCGQLLHRAQLAGDSLVAA
jgi:hypothetical protein